MKFVLLYFSLFIPPRPLCRDGLIYVIPDARMFSFLRFRSEM